MTNLQISTTIAIEKEEEEREHGYLEITLIQSLYLITPY
jgi:hypothetical protein